MGQISLPGTLFNKLHTMKKFVITCLLIFIGFTVFAQLKDPVKWTYSVKKINATHFEVHLTANIENGWHLYSQTTPAGGPVATNISFVKNPLIHITGDIKEVGKLEQRHEELFGVDVKQFSQKVDFVTNVTLRGAVKTLVAGDISFMTCNDRECLPPKSIHFSLSLN